jgi:hypothetical protein
VPIEFTDGDGCGIALMSISMLVSCKTILFFLFFPMWCFMAFNYYIYFARFTNNYKRNDKMKAKPYIKDLCGGKIQNKPRNN